MPIVMIEQKEAVENIEDILAVEGLAGVAIGPMDLAGSMGYSGLPGTPSVVEAVQHVIDKTRETDRFGGIGASEDVDVLTDLFKRGVHWSLVGNDYNLMIRWARSVTQEVEANLAAAAS
jgi:4-hydroxy-2-oxoheptanedioate aldolase